MSLVPALALILLIGSVFALVWGFLSHQREYALAVHRARHAAAEQALQYRPIQWDQYEDGCEYCHRAH